MWTDEQLWCSCTSKGQGRQRPGRNNVVRRDPKERKIKRRQWTHQEGKTKIWYRELKEQPRPRMERTTGNIFEDEAGDRSYIWEACR
jgi:hypothetical protein